LFLNQYPEVVSLPARCVQYGQANKELHHYLVSLRLFSRVINIEHPTVRRIFVPAKMPCRARVVAYVEWVVIHVANSLPSPHGLPSAFAFSKSMPLIQPKKGVGVPQRAGFAAAGWPAVAH
jgi:hypothetical protein